MIELERIKNNIEGELPESGKYGYFIVENIINPQHELNVFKETISVLIKNKHLSPDDPKWENLLSKQMVAFVSQLDDEDFHNDYILHSLPNVVGSFMVRKWEWYSSEVLENGFEVTFLGRDIGMVGTVLLHHQGLPYSSLFLEQNGNFYETRNVGTDVLSYKTFDRKTLKLK
ncbi:hypothetical protein GCM10007424_26450 [Flavobacterium suaedae]|uniref:Uncharacterized protein n=1 Tax=Flavobacterium suaedae TaxID=1767027 RepID=A0ABQ1K1I3_9FLAO|nr:hypothetical protein [Flavobacterium suaedae]GGB85111.1 hypothetical protein GCM10007424_26450 [Flavobacterium suaedae]